MGLNFLVMLWEIQCPLMTHLQRLAQKCGFDTYANTKDKILFAKYKPSTTHELTYGEDILS